MEESETIFSQVGTATELFHKEFEHIIQKIKFQVLKGGEISIEQVRVTKWGKANTFSEHITISIDPEHGNELSEG